MTDKHIYWANARTGVARVHIHYFLVRAETVFAQPVLQLTLQYIYYDQRTCILVYRQNTNYLYTGEYKTLRIDLSYNTKSFDPRHDCT